MAARRVALALVYHLALAAGLGALVEYLRSSAAALEILEERWGLCGARVASPRDREFLLAAEHASSKGYDDVNTLLVVAFCLAVMVLMGLGWFVLCWLCDVFIP